MSIQHILPNKELLTPSEVADHIHVSKRTVYRWIKGGKVDISYTPGGNPRIKRESILKLQKPKSL